MGHNLVPLPNFAGGELSPLLDARIDLPAYRKGLRKCRNMIVLKTGGVTRRPGTQFIALGKNDASATTTQPALSRLVKFQFAPGTTFQLEFGHKSIRFYSNGAQVTLGLSDVSAWVSGTSYPAGAFVSYLGQIYYRPTVKINSTIPPFGDADGWVNQSTYEVPSPYSGLNYTAPSYWDADVFRIQVQQVNDVVYIVHPSFPVYKLTSFSNINWKLQEVQFLTPAMLDQNATDTTLQAGATSGSGVSLTASAPAWGTSTYYQPGNSVLQGGVIYKCLVPHTSGTFTTDLANGDWQATPIFNALHVGSYWQLAYNPPASSQLIDQQINANVTSGTVNVLGSWNLLTYGTWTATLAVQASYDNGTTWQTVTTLTSTNDANFNISGQSLTPALYRIDITGYSSSTSATPPRVTLTPDNQFVYGLVQITGVTDNYNATCTVVNPLYATTATEFWSECAWSDYRGYPRAITVFQERMWYAGTIYQSQRIWGTQTNDIENFALLDQSQATDGMAFDLNAPGRGPIEWLSAQTDLMAGLSGAEWIVSSGQQNTAITPTQIVALEHSANGSVSNIPAQIIGNAAFFVQRRGASFMQMLYSVFTNKYMSQDMQVLSQHLTNAGVQQFDFQQQFQNQSILWAVTGDGMLIGMTYDMQQEVAAWHAHTTGDTTDKFLGVSVIYGAAGQDDEVWVTVLRQNMTQCTVERLYPINWQTANAGQPQVNEAWYADCAISVTSPVSNQIPIPYADTNLPQNRTFCASINGAIAVNNLSATLVTAGLWQVTIPNYVPVAGDVVVVGLPINWAVQPMRVDIVGNGVPVPVITKAVFQMWLRLVNSLGGQWQTEGGQAYDLPNYAITQNSGAAPTFPANTPVDVEVPVGQASQYAEDPQITVFGSDPLPMTILGITLKVDIGGKP